MEVKGFNLTVLSGTKRCHKLYRKGGVIGAKLPYDYFYVGLPYSDTHDLYNIIQEKSKLEDVGIITGQHVGGKKRDFLHRQNIQFADKDNQLLVCDFDEYPLPDDIENHTLEAIEYVVKTALPKEFHDVSYVAQWSSSSGLKNLVKGKMEKDGFNCHMFFISDTVLTSKDIKERLFHKHLQSRVKGEEEAGVDGSMFQQIQICFISSEADIDETYVDLLAGIEKVQHVHKSVDQVPVKLRSEEAAKKNKQRTRKKVATLTGHKSMNNNDAEVLLSQLIEMDVVRTINNNGSWNVRSGQASTGGSYVFESNPEWIYVNGKSVHIKKWAKDYWNVDIMMPEEVRIKGRNGKREVNTRTYYEHSDGDRSVLQYRVHVEYDDLKVKEHKALIVITNPGVGKTMGVPKYIDKLIYAKNSNKSVRELYQSLSSRYPNKVIQEIFNFKELFKEKFPFTTIIEYDTKDVFGGKVVKWQETFDTIEDEEDREEAVMMYKAHMANTSTVNYEADIVIMTNYKLHKLKHERPHQWHCGEEWFDWKGRYYDLTKDVKAIKIKKWLHRQLTKWEDRPSYQYYILSNEWTVVVDDPTQAETGLFNRVHDEDYEKIEEFNDRIDAFNTKVDDTIDGLGDDFDYTQNIEHLNTTIRKPYNEFLEYEGLDFIMKPAYMSITNTRLDTIYTCAEVLQFDEVEVELKKKKIPYKTLNLRELEEANNVLVMPTDVTNSQNDGMLEVIKNCADRTFKNDAVYVADGVGGEWNHTNTKGVNSLKDSDLVIKISRKHPDAIINRKTKFITDIDTTELVSSKEMTELMGDMEQAVGRNSGWRKDGGKSSYVFISPTVWFAIQRSTIYDMTIKPFNDYGQFLFDAVANVDKWFNRRGYSIDMFMADTKLNGKLDGKGYKRLIRITKAVHSLKDCEKKRNVLRILDDKMVDVCLVVDALAKIDGECYVTLEDLNIRCDRVLQVCEGLGVKTIRYSRKQHHTIVVNPYQIKNLQMMVMSFRAIKK